MFALAEDDIFLVEESLQSSSQIGDTGGESAMI